MEKPVTWQQIMETTVAKVVLLFSFVDANAICKIQSISKFSNEKKFQNLINLENEVNMK